MTQLDPETYQAVVHFATTLLQVLPDALGIDRIFPNCEVIDLDPYSEGSVPRYIQVSLKGREYIDVFWRGDPALEVGDYCTVIRFADGQRFEVFGAGGTTGKVLTAISQLSSYARGAIIRGGTSAWEALAVGAANTVLKSDGTDVAWGSVGHNELTGVTDSNHHNPITLDTNAETLLSLAAQVLGLDTQAANTALRGPASGADAVPTFRAAVNDDLPTINPSKLSPLLVENIFTATDGLLLLGPNCPITPTSWISPRGQKATISGAFHQVAGAWPGTRALMVEEGTTNLINNPSVETSLTGYSSSAMLARLSTQSRWGDYSLYFETTSATGPEYWIYPGTGTYGIPVSSSTAYTVSAYFLTAYDNAFQLRIYWYDSGGTYITRSNLNIGKSPHEFTRHILSATSPATAAYAAIYCIEPSGTASIRSIYMDGLQFEQKPNATSYCDGSLAWCSWSSTAHASTSTRAKTEINLDALVGYISGVNTLTFSVWWQPQYAATAIWPTAATLYDAGGVNDSNRIYLIYGLPAAGRYGVYINGAYRITSSAQTFNAGEWQHIVVTCDFSSNKYTLYVNGEVDGTDTTSLNAPTFSQFNLGSNYLGGYVAHSAIAQCAAFNTPLTAEQIAALHHRNAPLVDVGAYDTPVVDGRHIRLPVSNYNVSNPPTDAELTSAFGLQPDGFTGLVDDAGAGTTIWKVWRAANNWWYEQLTQAS